MLRNKEKNEAENKDKEELGVFLNEVLDEFTDLLEEEDILKSVYDSKGKEIQKVMAPSSEQGYGKDGKIHKKGGGKRKGALENKEDKSGEKKGKSTIKILVSNFDEDPLNKGNKYNMIEREPILNQRVQDVPHGIWWVNSEKKYIQALKVKDPSSWPFYFLLIKEVVYSHRQRKKFKDGERFEPDGLEQLNFDLIDEVFNRAVDKFRIDVLSDENINEKIRAAIRKKESFTVPDLAKELSVDQMSINVFIMNSKEDIRGQFNITKEKVEGHGRIVNLYTRK